MTVADMRPSAPDLRPLLSTAPPRCSPTLLDIVALPGGKLQARSTLARQRPQDKRLYDRRDASAISGPGFGEELELDVVGIAEDQHARAVGKEDDRGVRHVVGDEVLFPAAKLGVAGNAQ